MAKALALALLLPACNMAGLVVVQAAPDVGVLASPELRPYCEAAIGRWEHATGISMSCTEGRPLIRGTPSDPCAAASTRFSKVVVRDAQSAEDCTRAGVQDTYPDTSAELATAVAHELGHVLAGQRHNQHADDGLMSPAPELGARITTASLAFVCETAPCTKFEPEAE